MVISPLVRCTVKILKNSNGTVLTLKWNGGSRFFSDSSFINYVINTLWQTEPGSVISDPVQLLLRSRATATVDNFLLTSYDLSDSISLLFFSFLVQMATTCLLSCQDGQCVLEPALKRRTRRQSSLQLTLWTLRHRLWQRFKQTQHFSSLDYNYTMQPLPLLLRNNGHYLSRKLVRKIQT